MPVHPKILQDEPGVAVRDAIDDIARRRQAHERNTTGLRWAWVLLTAVLVLVLIDTAGALSGVMRLWVLLGFVAFAFVAVIQITRQPRESTSATARRLEMSHEQATNAVINAVQLASHPHVAAEGVRTLAAMDARRIFDVAAWRRHSQVTAGIMLAWIILTAAMPRLVGIGVLRFINPLGDHPPFSLTTYVVAVNPSEIFIGDDVHVNVEAMGLEVDRMELAMLDDNGRTMGRWPMTRVSDGRFVRTLVRVDEPISFHVQSDRGRSRRHRIEPAVRPIDAVNPLRESSVDRDSLRAVLRDIQRLANQLLRQISKTDTLFDPKAWRARVENLDAMREGIAELSTVGTAPTNSEDPAATTQWLRKLEAAAAAARGHLGDSAKATDSGSVSSHSDTELEPAAADPLASGRYDEMATVDAQAPPSLRAAIEQAPRSYRRLVADYFRLLGELHTPPEKDQP